MAGNIERLREGLLDWGWLAVPIISFGAIGLDFLFFAFGILPESMTGEVGKWGCILGAFLLAGIAILKPRKDIVSLVTPLYAIIFFITDAFSQGLLLQLLFAGSIAILAVRLQRRFSAPVERRVERIYTDEDDEQDGDEGLSD